jgi:hypothetical protein
MVPVEAVTPPELLASTRQNNGASGFSAVRNGYWVTSSTVSTDGAKSVESRPMRSRYVMGSANPGIDPALQAKSGVIETSVGGSGARGVTPSAKTAAALTSGRPQPEVESGAARLDA